MRELFEGLRRRNGVAVLNSGNVDPNQTGAFFEVSLLEVLRSADRPDTFADEHEALSASRFSPRVLQLDTERTLLGRDHDLVFAREPTDRPVEDRGLALHLLLQLRQRQFTFPVERLPDFSGGPANLIVHRRFLSFFTGC